MANTVIQIKRSTSTATPTNGSLATAEPAYSFNSDKLFLGNTSGTGVIEIGGKYWVDTTKAAFDQANAAYSTANTGLTVSAAFTQANTARDHANAAHLTANAGFDQANTARVHANAAHLTANAGFDQANTARTHANAAHITANAGFDQANVSYGQANTARDHANVSFSVANIAYDTANVAWAVANSKFSSNGGSITGDVSITGNLNLSGNTKFINVATYAVTDSLIYLAANNYVSDIVDIGFIASYNDGSANLHTGLFREHSNKEYYIFQGYTEEPSNNHIDPNANGFTIAVLNAAIRTSNLNLGGVNAITWITSSYDQANTARLHANGAFLNSNAAYDQANTARVHANAAHLTANAGFDQANTAYTHANASFLNANAAYVQANTSRDHANTVYTQANTARDLANTAATNAVNAFGKANTAGTDAVNAYSLANNGFAQANTARDQANTALTAAANGSYISTGIVKVPYGGTGMVTFTTNGILYGNSSGDLKVTSAGTEGQVLQASSSGVPNFGMLDGGTF